MTVVKKTIHVTTVNSPADINVSIKTEDQTTISVTPVAAPNFVIEPPEISIVGSAILGPQGMQGDKGDQGNQGPPGPATPTYAYTQLAPAYDWTVIHPLNKYPAVVVIDSGGTVLEPDIRFDSATHLTITFGSPTSGKAYLN